MKRGLIVGSVLAVLLATALVLFFAQRDGGTMEKSPGVNEPSAPTRSDGAVAQVTVVSVAERQLHETVHLPGELLPYLSVDLYPKITGILEWIGVDRGSKVKRGQVLIRLMAPELSAQRAEAEAKWRADEITYERLTTAAATPGVVAANDLETAKRTVEADLARVRSLREMEGYLIITAPFDGIITTRNIHPGALVGPMGNGRTGTDLPLIRLEQTDHLRLMVPVPETFTGDIPLGHKVGFAVPAFPGQTFYGTVTRVAHSIDVKTRTMPVEMDVENTSGRLASGMFPQVEWPVQRSRPTLFVPTKAVVTTTELTFVIRIQQDTVEWVKVQKGQAVGDLIEVFGDLHAGDTVVARGTDELRPGTKVLITYQSKT